MLPRFVVAGFDNANPLPLPNNQKRRLNLSKGPSVEVASTDREGEVGEAGLAQGQSAIISPPAGVCPTGAPVRAFRVSAVAAAQAIPGGTLVFPPGTRRASGRSKAVSDG